MVMLNVVVRFPSAWPWCGLVRRLEEGAPLVTLLTYEVVLPYIPRMKLIKM